MHEWQSKSNYGEWDNQSLHLTKKRTRLRLYLSLNSKCGGKSLNAIHTVSRQCENFERSVQASGVILQKKETREEERWRLELSQK